MLKDNFNKLLLEGDAAFKELKKLAASDKELKKMDKLDFIDAFYNKYEKQISKIEKKYKLGSDELGQMLMDL